MDYSTLPPRHDKSRRRRSRSVWPVILAMVCFFGAAVAGAMFASESLLDSQREKEITKRESQEKEVELLRATSKATIMLMGVDKRKDDVGRSDTLMIATIDPELDRVSLLSIPRDTRVKIRGHGFDKINAAYAYGGEKLTYRTVEEFLGLDIDHYVLVNVQGFVKIIDAIGGVDIDVEKRMYYEDPWDDDGGLVIDLRPGLQHMDGKTAVTYVRYRDEDGDIGRVKRQQKFMQACLDKVASPSIIPKLPGIIKKALDAVETDMSLRQLLELAGTIKSAQKNGMDAEMVPGSPLYIRGISYWIPDIGKLRLALAEVMGVPMNSYLRSYLERQEREYENSIPAGASETYEGENTVSKHGYRPSTNKTKRQNETKEETSRSKKDTALEDSPRTDIETNKEEEKEGTKDVPSPTTKIDKEPKAPIQEQISQGTEENKTPTIGSEGKRD